MRRRPLPLTLCLLGQSSPCAHIKFQAQVNLVRSQISRGSRNRLFQFSRRRLSTSQLGLRSYPYDLQLPDFTTLAHIGYFEQWPHQRNGLPLSWPNFSTSLRVLKG